MKLWYCMECQTTVGLGRHGQCELCESEAVDMISSNDELNHSVSEGHKHLDVAQACN
jgi:hypothetical protein